MDNLTPLQNNNYDAQSFRRLYRRRFFQKRSHLTLLLLTAFFLLVLKLAESHYTGLANTTLNFREQIKNTYIAFVENRTRFNATVTIPQSSALPESNALAVPAATVVRNTQTSIPILDTLDQTGFSGTNPLAESMQLTISGIDSFGTVPASEAMTFRYTTGRLWRYNSDYTSEAFIDDIGLDIPIIEGEGNEYVQTFEIPEEMLFGAERFQQGWRDSREVDLVLRRHLPKFEDCFKRAAQQTRELNGHVKMRFIVLPNGRIKRNSIRILENTTEDNKIARCLKRKIMQIKAFSEIEEANGPYEIIHKVAFY
jgi:hypothetical protein